MTGYTSSIGVMSYDTAGPRNRINPIVIPHSIHVEYSDHAKRRDRDFFLFFFFGEDSWIHQYNFPKRNFH